MSNPNDKLVSSTIEDVTQKVRGKGTEDAGDGKGDVPKLPMKNEPTPWRLKGSGGGTR